MTDEGPLGLGAHPHYPKTAQHTPGPACDLRPLTRQFTGCPTQHAAYVYDRTHGTVYPCKHIRFHDSLDSAMRCAGRLTRLARAAIAKARGEK